MDFRQSWVAAFIALWALSGRAASGSTPAPVAPADSAAATFFESKVRPVLAENCTTCHGDARQSAGLRLDSRAALLKGGADGPVLVPGDPDKSALVRAIRYDGKLRMPPTGKLKPDEIAALTTWVQMGAPWPEEGKREEGKGNRTGAPPAGQAPEMVFTPAQRRFWSFLPVKRPAVPAVKNRAWVRSPLDAFLLAKLEAKGLKPAPPADRRTLIRRATFDLTGLPPTPAEVEAFVNDKAPDAWARVVDRLLASPRYGERWGRHWLDVVRYADSYDARGLGGEGDIREAWRYRDWVVGAFNKDLPYNQFIINQIAGDLLPAARPGETNADGIVATGMLAIGNWGNGDADKEKLLTDIVDDQIDVVSRGFLGLTVACARCHNHKFDPIPTKDYYGLAGIFTSTHILPGLAAKGSGESPLHIPLLSKAEMEQRDRLKQRAADLEKQVAQERATQVQAFAQSLLPQTTGYLLGAWDYLHRPAGQAKLSVADFASQHGLYGYALQQWMDVLDSSGDYRLMTVLTPNVGGVNGVFSWRGAADCPNLIVNPTDKPVSLGTPTLPAHSVCMHPGPANGVAIGWTSPVTGVIRLTGGVTDADPQCGDGIAWVLDHRTASGPSEIASGDFPNGGAQLFSQGQGAANLAAVNVKAGDRIDLLVLPKADYSCDTTAVALTIALADGSRRWDITQDMLQNPVQDGMKNPHPDGYGEPGVWSFFDMADSRRAQRPAGFPEEALAGWEQAATQAADRATLEQAAKAFQQAFTLSDARSPFWLRKPEDERFLPQPGRDALVRLAAARDAANKDATVPIPMANGAQEGGCPGSPQAGIHDVRIHIRGSYMRLGDLVPRHFPIILAGTSQAPITQGSGRLELAKWIASDTNALTARVIVNRVWQHHFGEGIVRTPSNFGFLGERPIHPELLDWLASEFMANGWSLKKLHREIMLSSAYRQSSDAPARMVQADPDNRLFGRMTRLRLESEAIRDSLLAVSGKLDTTMGGPALRDLAAPRRTLYLMTVRSDRSGFGPLFDAADSSASVDRRTVSTVAPQALFLLNNPFVLDQAQTLSRRLATEAGTDDRARIARAYPLLYGRPPTPDEVRIGLAFLERARRPETTAAVADGDGKQDRAWEGYCQILLCANEFLYVD